MATSGKRLYPRAREDNPGAVKYPLVTRKAGILLALALELPGSIIGGLAIGYFLDQYFNTSPWLMMALTILGFTAACIRLVRWARFFSDKRNETNMPDTDRSAHAVGQVHRNDRVYRTLPVVQGGSRMDFEKAKLDPAAVFKSPQEVVSSEQFSREQKIEILQQWEQEARSMEVAEEENMPGPQTKLLQPIRDALHALNYWPDSERSGPSKA